jgi:hypothetical protein
MFNKGTFCSPEFLTLYKKFQGRQSLLLELSPLEAFEKCYKLRTTKCTFVEHSSGIISPVILCKVLQIQGYKMYLVTFFWNWR